MIIRWYEISCDKCGGGDHFQGNKKTSEQQARRLGWIIKNKKHFDTSKCRDDFKALNNGET